MITKNHWDKFCRYVYTARQMGMTPYMKGERVYQIHLDTDEIVTVPNRDQPRKRYSHKDSLNPNVSLDYLYSMITFSNVSMLDIMRFSQKLKEIKEFEGA